MLSELRFLKSVRFFEQNCFVKLVIFFASFRWPWHFLPENLKLIDKLQKRCFKSFIFWSKFRFLGTILGCFSQCNFTFCRLRTTACYYLPLPAYFLLAVTVVWCCNVIIVRCPYLPLFNRSFLSKYEKIGMNKKDHWIQVHIFEYIR